MGNTGLQHQPDQDPVMVWGGLAAVGAVPSLLPSGLQIGLMRARRERTIGSAIEVHTAGGRGGGVSLSVR